MAIERTGRVDRSLALRRAQSAIGRTLTYAALIAWAFVCLFPLYWTFTTSIKDQVGVLRGPTYIPYVDFEPSRIGWDSILSGDQRDILIRDARNSLIVGIGSAAVAV